MFGRILNMPLVMIMINVQSRIKYKVNFNKYLNIKLRSCVFVSGGKKSLLFKKYGMFCFLVTSVLSLTLLPCYRRIIAFKRNRTHLALESLTEN